MDGNELDTNVLESEATDLVAQVIEEKDPKKVKDLTDLFNATMSKKSMVRITKLNDLLDRTTDQALERFEKQPDQFSNKELLDYMNTVSTISDRALASLKANNEVSSIQLNQQNNNVNISVGGSDISNLTRESRARILDAVNSILNPTTQEEVLEVEPVIKNPDSEPDETL